MGVAPEYDDLIGVVPKRLLHVDHARRVPTLIFSSADNGRQRSELLGFAGVFDNFWK